MEDTFNAPSGHIGLIAKHCLDFALSQTKKGNSAFSEYSGHCQCVSIRIHKGIWDSETNAQSKFDYYFYEWNTIDECKEVLKGFKTQLGNNKNHT